MNKVVKPLKILLAIVLLFGMVGSAAPAAVGMARAHPLLVRMAEESPQQQVAVIVQKLGSGAAVESRVASFGGKITKDLHIINAFAAELPAWAAVELSRRQDVRWVSLDAPVVKTDWLVGNYFHNTKMMSKYVSAIHADDLWQQGIQGSSVTVAVIDSGMSKHFDFRYRILQRVKVNDSFETSGDVYGHGTHIGGIIGGDGFSSFGRYIGVAPQVNLVSVRVSDDQGMSFISDVVAGLQWVYENKDAYNIRVVNLSLNSTIDESYHVNPLDAAVEILWFNGIVVVVSAGNSGANQVFPPANDPFVITVGAANDFKTGSISDDSLASFSAYGNTIDGFAKPDLVAPGVDIVSTVPNDGGVLSQLHPDHRVMNAWTYFRMSGTSMSSAVAAGAVALLLQDEPGLNPDQVKFRLMATAAKNDTWPAYDPYMAGAGYLDIYAAVLSETYETANTGLDASQLLWTGDQPIAWDSVSWNSVSWNSVSWNSVSWNSVSWNSVSWNSVVWNSDYWEP